MCYNTAHLFQSPFPYYYSVYSSKNDTTVYQNDIQNSCFLSLYLLSKL